MGALQLNTEEEGDDEELSQAVVNRLVALKQIHVSRVIFSSFFSAICSQSSTCIVVTTGGCGGSQHEVQSRARCS
jgi:hypothetical protein